MERIRLGRCFGSKKNVITLLITTLNGMRKNGSKTGTRQDIEPRRCMRFEIHTYCIPKQGGGCEPIRSI